MQFLLFCSSGGSGLLLTQPPQQITARLYNFFWGGPSVGAEGGKMTWNEPWGTKHPLLGAKYPLLGSRSQGSRG